VANLTAEKRLATLAQFIRNQVGLAERPPPGCIQLNNEEALLCAQALERAVETSGRMEKLQQERLTWAMACPCSCPACEKLHDLIRDEYDDPKNGTPETPASHRLDGFGDCRNPGCTYPSVSNWDASKCESSEKAGEKHG
jgi:hypothetical protein